MAFSSRQFALKIKHGLAWTFFFLSKRSGPRVPPAERSALYHIQPVLRIAYSIYFTTETGAAMHDIVEAPANPALSDRGVVTLYNAHARIHIVIVHGTLTVCSGNSKRPHGTTTLFEFAEKHSTPVLYSN